MENAITVRYVYGREKGYTKIKYVYTRIEQRKRGRVDDLLIREYHR